VIFKGSQGTLSFNLNDYSTKAGVLAAVQSVTYLGQSTKMADGLNVARLQVFGSNYQRRPNIDPIIILITDGKPSSSANTLDEADAVKRMGIRIIGLGITNGVCQFRKSFILYCLKNYQ